MILQGEIIQRICSNVFQIQAGYKIYKVEMKRFEPEVIRNNGHFCESHGFVVGLPLEAEFDENERLIDVKFATPDADLGVREVSFAANVMSDGATSFLQRKECGGNCSIFCGYKSVLRNFGGFVGFVEGQRFNHCACVGRGNRLEADDVRILELNPQQSL